ncbi:MAG TPA: DUF3014 domain-containing protein [Thermoanaerobaculia bacterium]|nr:DUF3014 domain-containing protein [Thermoanaerobaculia bacterium]
MRNLDDFDLRPGDSGNPRRQSAPPGHQAAQRSDLAHPRLGRGGLMFDEAAAEAAAAEEVAALGEPSPAPPITPRGAPRLAPPAAPRGYRDSTPSAPRSSSRALGATIATLIAAALVVAFWLMSRRVEPPAPGTVASEEASPAAPEAAGDEPRRSVELEAPLPPLDESDALVRELVGGLSSNPALATWLGNPNLVRAFAAAVENTSLGQTPSPNLSFLRPREKYRAVERSGADGPELVPDPASYRRYDLVTAVFTSLDPQATADVYRRLHGLVQEAYADLGYPDENVDHALATAFETLLQTPLPATAPPLERHLETYHYVDPRLEALQPAQKQLLRMGPENAARVQDQLRRLAAALDLPVD